MRSIWQDIQLGFRMLAKKPTVTVIAIVTVALGIGATTAVFTYLDQFLYHPYLYEDQDILVRVDGYDKKRGQRTGVLYPPDFLDIERNQDVFETIGAFRFRTRITPSAEGPEEIRVSDMTAGMLPTLGVQPVLGRWFMPEECQQGNDNVVLLNYSYWRDRYAFDRDILGKEIQLNDRFHKIIGVMPRGFFNNPYAYLPLVFTEEELSEHGRSGRAGFVQSWAKFKPGVTFEQAQANMTAIAAALEQRYPGTNTDRSVEIFHPRDRDRKRFADEAVYFVLPALFVILIVCANVAHLQLTRAAERQKEVAVRAAMGAGRWTLIRQFLIESVILSVVGGGLGIVVAYVGLDALLAINPDRAYSRLEFIEVDRNALYFTVGLSCLTGVLFGLAPAWIGSKTNLNNVLKEGSARASAATRGKRLRQVLIVSEIALTTVLLVGAGLMLRTLWQAARMNVGYDTSVVTVTTGLQRSDWKDREDVMTTSTTFMNSALEQLRALPGVRSAGGAASYSLRVGSSGWSTIQKASGVVSEADRKSVTRRYVTADFFQTLGIPILRGRIFDKTDGQRSNPVAIVSESLARDLFPGENPLGKRIVRPKYPQEAEPPEPWQIVGVVGDVRWSAIPTDPDLPEVYTPYWQDPTPYLAFALKVDGDPAQLAQPVRERLLALNQNMPVEGFTTLNEQLINQVRSVSLFPAVMITFASIAVLLAAVGIYGLTSYSVSQRTQELGIRMALGAQRSDIVAMVIRQGVTLGGLGIVLGALGSWGLIQVLRSVLSEEQLRGVGLTSVDLTTCVMVLLFLAMVSVAANYSPRAPRHAGGPHDSFAVRVSGLVSNAMRTIWQDTEFGLRVLVNKPMTTLVAVVTLALGIGATTAVFTYLDQYLFHRFIYKDQGSPRACRWLRQQKRTPHERSLSARLP